MAELIPIEPDQIPQSAPSKGREILQRFLSLDKGAARVELDDDEKPHSIAWSIRRAIEKAGAKVVVKTVKGNIYLRRV
jgi:hypothetical protein